MAEPLLFLVLTLASFRVGRFVSLDDLWDVTRNRLLNWLERPGKTREKPPAWGVRRDAPPLWRFKLSNLIGCPWCVLVWTSAGVVFVTDAWFQHLPMPVWWWLAVSGGAAICWQITDHK